MEEGGKQGALWSMGISIHCAQNSTLVGVVGGGGGGRGGGRSPVLLISYHRKVHSGLTHLDMASFFRNPF